MARFDTYPFVTEPSENDTVLIYDQEADAVKQTSLSAVGIHDGSAAMGRVYYDTKAGWNAQDTLISQEHAIYVYTDYKTVGNVTYQGIKIGDGTSYLIDLPFLDAELQAHLQNNTIHITSSERAAWNSKVGVSVSGENLIFAT